VRCQPLGLTDESAIQDWAAQMYEIDWLVNSAGMLHTPVKDPEKTIRHIEPAFLLQNRCVNALPEQPWGPRHQRRTSRNRLCCHLAGGCMSFPALNSPCRRTGA